MKIYCLALTFFLTAIGIASGAALEFKEHNCAIEFPAGWQLVSPPPTQTLAVAQSPDGQKIVLLAGIKTVPTERVITRGDLFMGNKQSAAEKGFKVIDLPETMLGGIPFDGFLAEGTPPASIISYSTATMDDTFMLQVIFKAGDARNDPEIQSILKSFRLLFPAAALPRLGSLVKPDTGPHGWGYFLGRFGPLVIIAAGLVWLIRKLSGKRTES